MIGGGRAPDHVLRAGIWLIIKTAWHGPAIQVADSQKQTNYFAQTEHGGIITGSRRLCNAVGW